MTEKIRTRLFNYGDEKESTWPPLFGTGGAGLYHYRDGKLQEGPPPSNIKKFGEAPFVIQDTIEPHYHHGACRWTDSRSEINQFDKATGCITTDKRQDVAPYLRAREKRLADERKKDINQAMQRAVNDIDYGMAPLSEETKAKCAIQNEIVSDALGFDAFNVAGRKKDPRGKKYRKRT